METKSKYLFVPNFQSGRKIKIPHSARAHAASWARSGRPRGKRNHVGDEASNVAATSPIETDSESARESRSSDDPLQQGVVLKVPETAGSSLPADFFLGVRFDAFSTLPRLYGELNDPWKFSPHKGLMYEILGQDFVNNIILSPKVGDSTTIFASYLLLSYAHYVALTSKIQTVQLFQLKGEVIKRIKEAINTSNDKQNYDRMVAIQALGSPIVCLITHTDFPAYVAEKHRRADRRYSPALEDYDPKEFESDALGDYETHRDAVDFMSRGAMRSNPSELAQSPSLAYVVIYQALCKAFDLIIEPNATVSQMRNLVQQIPSRIMEDISKDPNSSRWYSPICGNIAADNPSATPDRVADRWIYELSRSTQSWLDTFLQPDAEGTSSSNSRLRLRRHYRSVLHDLPYLDDESDSQSLRIYKACRMTVKLMLHAENYQQSLPQAGTEIDFADPVVELLRSTDLTKLWSNYTGLLLWITSVLHIAPTPHRFRLTSITILTHFAQRVAAASLDPNIILQPLQTLLWFCEICQDSQ